MTPFHFILAGGIIVILSGAFVTALMFPSWLWPYFAGIALFLLLLGGPIGCGIDNLHARIIRRRLRALGALDVVVKPFSNHYGVTYSLGGHKQYGKCRVMKWGELEWQGASPEDLIRSRGVV